MVQSFPLQGYAQDTTNISYLPIHVQYLPAPFEQLGYEVLKAAVYLLIPTEIMYFSIYFKIKGYYSVYKSFTFLSIFAFWISHIITPVQCGPVRSMQNFASEYLSRFLQLET